LIEAAIPFLRERGIAWNDLDDTEKALLGYAALEFDQKTPLMDAGFIRPLSDFLISTLGGIRKRAKKPMP